MLSENMLTLLYSEYDYIDYTNDAIINDINRVYRVSRLIKKYVKTGKTAPRMLVNNILILYNVFGQTAYYALHEGLAGVDETYLNTVLKIMGRTAGDCQINDAFLKYIEEGLN